MRAEIGLESREARMCLTVGTLTQKVSSAADYQFPTQPVRGGSMTQLQWYVYIYRPLRVIWPLAAKKTKAPKSPNQSAFIFL